MLYAQFREGSAFLHSEKGWGEEALQPNYRRARIVAPTEQEACAAFETLRQACLEASPVIDWEKVSERVEEF